MSVPTQDQSKAEADQVKQINKRKRRSGLRKEILSGLRKENADNSFAWMLKFKDFLISYNKLSELCFVDCVHDFTVRKVWDKEDRCTMNCLEKYLKMNQRISQRFQEFQLLTNEAALAAIQKASNLAP